MPALLLLQPCLHARQPCKQFPVSHVLQVVMLACFAAALLARSAALHNASLSHAVALYYRQQAQEHDASFPEAMTANCPAMNCSLQ